MVTSEAGGSSARFPAVTGRSLLGVELALPRDFPAERTLAVVAFRQWHQARVDRWIARAVADGVPPTPRGHTGVLPTAVVELPVLATAWRPVRRFIDGGMTAGIGDPDVLARGAMPQLRAATDLDLPGGTLVALRWIMRGAPAPFRLLGPGLDSATQGRVFEASEELASERLEVG